MRSFANKLVGVLFLTITSVFVSNSQEINHGLVLGGGLGFINGLKYDVNGRIDNIIKEGGDGGFSRKGGIFIGYKLRMSHPQNTFFYDLDLLAGARLMKYSYYPGKFPSPSVNQFLPSEQVALYSFSINPSINYRLWRGLYAGAGISPTLYYRRTKDDRWVFDTSITPRLGYTFRKIDVALSYRWGLLNKLLDVDDFSGGRLSSLDAQLSIFF